MADVSVSVDLDTAPAEREAQGLKGKLKTAFSDMGSIAGGVFMAQVGGAITGKGVEVLTNSITLARDYNEILSKSNTVFGDQATAIEQWARSASTSFGQSKAQALDAASGFGNMFSQLGIGAPIAADMSVKMTELASDFASFHNADISQVLDAQASAFRGEYDALQKFVPTISAATVEQKALAQTGKATTGELTAQEKAVAAYSVMLENAGDAAGDFDRTQGSLSNQQRILSAQWEDFQTQMGQALIPALTAVVTAINTQVIPAVQDFASKVKGYWETDLKPALDNLRAAWEKIDQVVLPILQTFIDDIGRVATAVGLAIGIVVDLIQGDWSGAFDKAKEVVRLAKDSIVEKFGMIKDGFSAVIDGIKGLWDDVLKPFFQDLPGNIVEAIGDLSTTLLQVGKDLAGGFVDGVKGALGGLMDIVAALINPVIDAFNSTAARLPGVGSIPRIGGGGGSTSQTGGPVPGGDDDQMPGREVFGQMAGGGGAGGGAVNGAYIPGPAPGLAWDGGAQAWVYPWAVGSIGSPGSRLTGANAGWVGGAPQIIQLAVDGQVLAQVVNAANGRAY